MKSGSEVVHWDAAGLRGPSQDVSASVWSGQVSLRVRLSQWVGVEPPCPRSTLSQLFRHNQRLLSTAPGPEQRTSKPSPAGDSNHLLVHLSS